MTLEDRLKQIEEHFENFSDEESEENLIACGFGTIKPCSDSNMSLI